MTSRSAPAEQITAILDMVPKTAAYVGVAAVPTVAETPGTDEAARATAFQQALAAAPQWVRYTHDTYLGEMTHALFGAQTALTQNKPPREQWGPWLATYATPEELHRLAAQHAHNMLAINADLRVQSVLERRREWHVDRLKDAVRLGWFSPTNAPRAIRRIQQTTVTLGDPLQDEILLSGARGYWTHGTTDVVIRQALDAPPKDRRSRLMDILHSSTILHEQAHSGFSERTDEASIPTWLEETGTEDSVQVVNALANGEDPGVLYPSRHSSTDLRRAYEGGRLVRYAMLNHGPRTVDTKKYMRAWSSEGRGSAEMADFERDLDRAWGVRNVFDRVTRRLEEVERLLQLRHGNRPGYINKNEAARQVAHELERQPQEVFGRGYKRPKVRPVGTAALAGARR